MNQRCCIAVPNFIAVKIAFGEEKSFYVLREQAYCLLAFYNNALGSVNGYW